MKLVIAEKPSVGRTIAAAISSHPKRENGYIDCGSIGGEKTLVSWAQGHLIDLADPKAYGDRWQKWTLDTLPVDPGERWKWTVSREKGAGARYRALVPLMRRADTLVNACDPDREGEGIFTRIVTHARLSSKPALRLWTNSMDADGIRKAWRNMKPEKNYVGLAEASDARAKADWMQGMTASRAYSLLYNAHASVGRVESPTLAMIVERDREISNHVAKPFWTVRIPMPGGWTLESERLDSEDKAQAALSGIGPRIRIDRVTRRTVKSKAPTLYDLTTLQRDANSMCSLTAGQTLAALQNLYEKGYATYPRTDSKYVTTDDLPEVKRLLASPTIRGFARSKDFGTPNVSQVANNKRVEGHTALLPTGKLTPAAYKGLPKDEQKVIYLISNRLWQATGSPRIHEETQAETNISGVNYSGTSDRTIDPGWTRFQPRKTKATGNIIPPDVKTGSVLSHGKPEISKGMTKPPSPYTDASLLSAMEHASRQLSDKTLKAALDDDTVHSGGLGTPATRAGIIDKIIHNRYAARHGRQIRSTTEGQHLIDMLSTQFKDVATTARMEQGLTNIAEGKQSEQSWLTVVHEQTRQILPEARKAFNPSLASEEGSTSSESFGPCPLCGKPVVKTRNGFWKCSNNRSIKQGGKWVPAPGSCSWGVFRKTIGNNRKRLTDSLVRQVLAGKHPRVKNAVKSKKTGKTYDLILCTDPKWGIDGDFPERNRK